LTSTLLDVLRGGAALAAVLLGIVLIRTVCRSRAYLRRLTLALSLIAAAGGLALFRYLIPATADALASYQAVLVVFALAYTAFKVIEVVVLDVVTVRQGGVPPPAILRDIVAAVFGALVLFLLLRAGLGADLTALVATSAALSLVLGLALQETLANLFAGLALMVERPFDQGDWVRFGDRVGRVTEVSWRAVKLQILRQEDYLIIPNSVVAKSEIVNLSQPTPLHGHTVDVGVEYGEPPNRVRDVLIEAALEVEHVTPQPRPRAAIIRFDPYAVVYRLTYWIRDYARVHDAEGEVLSRVWYAFRRHGIKIPFPTSDVNWRDASIHDGAVRRRELHRIAGLLKRVDFLAALTQEDVDRLTAEVAIAPHPEGRVVVRQGEPGDSLFIVATGRVQVSAQPPGGGADRPIAVIEPGDYFGEMSLLTGAPRSATVRAVLDTELLELTREQLRPILVGDPAAAERLSQVLAKRQAERDETVRPAATAVVVPGGDTSRFLLGSIRRFFGLIGGE
jgi:small-conductance mechanosensitive channel